MNKNSVPIVSVPIISTSFQKIYDENSLLDEIPTFNVQEC